MHCFCSFIYSVMYFTVTVLFMFQKAATVKVKSQLHHFDVLRVL